MRFGLYCTVLGILVFSPETDGSNLTWHEPLPSQTISDSNQFIHRNDTRLLKGTINASLSWLFVLSSDLTLDSLSLRFNGGALGGVDDSITTVLSDKYHINWIPGKGVTLIILKVTNANNGEYSCDVIGKKPGAPTTWRSIINVNIVAPPSDMNISDSQTVVAPAPLNLYCSAFGEPNPNITWTRVSDNVVVTMPLNIIGGKNKESYRCSANNGVGDPLTNDVVVIILFSPIVTLARTFFVDREQTASLNCQAIGNPAPTISWTPCDLLPKPVCDNEFLNISNVQTARANYTCMASNSLGNDSATTVLFIGGRSVYVQLSVSGDCGNEDSVWKKLEEELVKVFANTRSYIEAKLIVVRCGSLIFDVALRFSNEVPEDEAISIIQNAIVDGKLGELSVNVSYIIGIPPVEQTTITSPTNTTPKSDDKKTGIIIGVVLGSVAFVALIIFIIWCVRKKKCCSETKVSDNTDSAQGRKGKGQNRGDEVEYASTSMLPHSKRPVEKTNQGTVQALPMYAQVDKTKKTSNKGGAAQRQRQPGELQYAEVEHVTSGKSLPRKSSSEPIKPSNKEIVYADLV